MSFGACATSFMSKTAAAPSGFMNGGPRQGTPEWQLVAAAQVGRKPSCIQNRIIFYRIGILRGFVQLFVSIRLPIRSPLDRVCRIMRLGPGQARIRYLGLVPEMPVRRIYRVLYTGHTNSSKKVSTRNTTGGLDTMKQERPPDLMTFWKCAAQRPGWRIYLSLTTPMQDSFCGAKLSRGFGIGKMPHWLFEARYLI